jgi:hypothetical protein
MVQYAQTGFDASFAALSDASSPWERAWEDHEVVDLAVGLLALHLEGN